jgi:hypothetical protein
MTIKLLFDLRYSSIAYIFLAIPMLITALVVILTSPGPILSWSTLSAETATLLDAFGLNLLDAYLFLELSCDPHRLEALLGGRVPVRRHYLIGFCRLYKGPLCRRGLLISDRALCAAG